MFYNVIFNAILFLDVVEIQVSLPTSTPGPSSTAEPTSTPVLTITSCGTSTNTGTYVH